MEGDKADEEEETFDDNDADLDQLETEMVVLSLEDNDSGIYDILDELVGTQLK